MPSTFETIATATVSGTPTTVTFSAIPQTYTDIYYTIYTPTMAGVNTNANFNADTASNYSFIQMYADGTNAASTRLSNTAYLLAGISDGTAAIHGHIMSYSNSTTNKTILVRGGGNRYVELSTSVWRNTAPVTSISMVAANWSAGSIITLYGIKAA
jgi:hypothetical protein